MFYNTVVLIQEAIFFSDKSLSIHLYTTSVNIAGVSILCNQRNLLMEKCTYGHSVFCKLASIVIQDTGIYKHIHLCFRSELM